MNWLDDHPRGRAFIFGLVAGLVGVISMATGISIVTLIDWIA